MGREAASVAVAAVRQRDNGRGIFTLHCKLNCTTLQCTLQAKLHRTANCAALLCTAPH